MKTRIISTLFFLFFLFFIPIAFAEKIVIIPLGKTIKIEAPINWKGTWLTSANYKVGDGVHYEGSSYLCLQEHFSSVSNFPPSAYWDLMALRGTTGATGSQGLKGNSGAKGDTGNVGATGPQGPKGDKGEKGDTGLSGTDSWIDDSGVVSTINNVGIGTTSPQGLFHVAGNDNGDAEITVTDSGNVGIELRSSGEKDSYIDFVENSSSDNSSNGVPDLSARIIFKGTVDNTLRLGHSSIPSTLVLTENGNVGIGTTDPLSKLAISGLPTSPPDVSGNAGCVCVTNDGNLWLDNDGTNDCL